MTRRQIIQQAAAAMGMAFVDLDRMIANVESMPVFAKKEVPAEFFPCEVCGYKRGIKSNGCAYCDCKDFSKKHTGVPCGEVDVAILVALGQGETIGFYWSHWGTTHPELFVTIKGKEEFKYNAHTRHWFAAGKEWWKILNCSWKWDFQDEQWVIPVVYHESMGLANPHA